MDNVIGGTTLFFFAYAGRLPLFIEGGKMEGAEGWKKEVERKE